MLGDRAAAEDCVQDRVVHPQDAHPRGR
jgi:hypothetical protein